MQHTGSLTRLDRVDAPAGLLALLPVALVLLAAGKLIHAVALDKLGVVGCAVCEQVCELRVWQLGRVALLPAAVNIAAHNDTTQFYSIIH